MGPVFIYELRRFLRARALLVWTLVFPLILSVMFIFLFSGITGSITPRPVPLGVVQDQAYKSAPGLDALVKGLSDPSGEHHYADVTTYATAQEAEAAARAEETVGYLVVVDDKPTLRLTIEGNERMTSIILRRSLDAYQQAVAQQQELLAAGAGAARLAGLQEQHVFTHELRVTPAGVGSTARYYFSLLAFTAGMGMMLALQAVQGVMAPSGHLGARRTLAGTARWQVLTGVLGAAWLCVTASLGITFVFMWAVADVSFGPNAHLAPVLIVASGLMSCAVGAALGTLPRLSTGVVAGLASLLSLFTGLYGPGAQRLADLVEHHVPVLAWANPLWQLTHGFYSLLYYDSLAPFARSCGALVSMAALCLAVTVLRVRRMSHDHL